MNSSSHGLPTRLVSALVAAALLAAASLAGLIDARIANDREAESFFYLTNPHGPAGDYRASQLTMLCATGSPTTHGCDPAEVRAAQAARAHPAATDPRLPALD